jgi:seryl-tRNA synthetase
VRPPSLRHLIRLDPPVPEALADQLATRLFFVSEAIVDFSLVRSGGQVQAVELAVGDHVDPDELARKLRFVTVNDVLAQRPVESRVVWSSAPTREPRDVFPELLRRGIATEAGEGQVAVGEPVLSLMDHLDARVRALAMSEPGAREFRYPTLLPAAVMERGGYLRSFPHLMMFVTRLHGDVDTYRQFADSLARGEDLGRALRSGCQGFDYCLPPTMCFHTYHQLAERPLPEPSLVVTSRGKSFRFESRYRRSMERLWDFTIREIVFLGPRDLVLEGRRRLMERTFALAEALGLGGRCEVANDPFFIDTNTAGRSWSQRMFELKYELRLPVTSSGDIAVCSFNFHERFFGESFGIASAGGEGLVHTACAGFGLERFAYAFLCQHGVDPSGWPGEVREAVAGRRDGG